MAFPTVEVVYAPGTDAIKASPTDASLVAGTCEILKSTEGHIKSHYGVQHEDKSTAYMTVAWETLAHHHKLMNDKETYPKLTAAIQGMLNLSGLKMFHVAVTGDPFPALNAPVTELATVTLQEGKSKEELEAVLGELSKAISAAPVAVSPVWGPLVEKENTWALFIGWTTIEAHWALVKGGDQTVTDIVTRLRSLANVELVHIPFTPY